MRTSAAFTGLCFILIVCIDQIHSYDDFDKKVQNLLESRKKLSANLAKINKAKKQCSGFSCVYTHLGAASIDKARKAMIHKLIRECQMNPSCGIARRRRSIRTSSLKSRE